MFDYIEQPAKNAGVKSNLPNAFAANTFNQAHESWKKTNTTSGQYGGKERQIMQCGRNM